MFFVSDRICAFKAKNQKRPHSSHKILFPFTSEKKDIFITLSNYFIMNKTGCSEEDITHLTLNSIVYYILMSPS